MFRSYFKFNIKYGFNEQQNVPKFREDYSGEEKQDIFVVNKFYVHNQLIFTENLYLSENFKALI